MNLLRSREWFHRVRSRAWAVIAMAAAAALFISAAIDVHAQSGTVTSGGGFIELRVDPVEVEVGTGKIEQVTLYRYDIDTMQKTRVSPNDILLLYPHAQVRVTKTGKGLAIEGLVPGLCTVMVIVKRKGVSYNQFDSRTWLSIQIPVNIFATTPPPLPTTPPPPDPELGIWVSPLGPYIPGQTITLRENCKNLPNDTKYNWYFGFFNDKIGSGKRITYKLPDEKGTYDVTLGLRFGSDNFDSLKTMITITVGPTPIGLMGSHVNRFRIDGVPDNVRIASSYWKGGYTASSGYLPLTIVKPGWSDFVYFRNVGAVDACDFYTGLQADGHNNGFLVYVPKGRNEIQFKICGFTFGDPGKTPGAFTGYVRYSRNLPIKGGHTVIPQTLRWVEQHARCGVAEWQTEQGSICSARIWKTESSAGMTGSGAWQNVYVEGGLEDLGCDQYDPRTDPGTGTTAASIAAATQGGGHFQAGSGQPPGGGVGSGNLSNVTVSQHDITVTFWDHGTEDGDIINIYLNGKLFKGNVRLTNKKKKFQVKLNSGNNTFEVEAVNEGSIPPNTASVRISHVTLGRASQIYEKKSGKRTSMNLSAP